MKNNQVAYDEPEQDLVREPAVEPVADDVLQRYMRGATAEVSGPAQPTAMELAFARVEEGLVKRKAA